MTKLQELSRQALCRDPALPAIEFEGRWYSWGDLRRVADAVQSALNASGIAPQAPVAFVPRNRPASIATLLALLAQGRTIRMIYAFQSPTGVAQSIERLRPAAVVAHAEDLAAEVQTSLAAQGLPSVALNGMNAAALPGFERASSASEWAAPSEPQIEILTSGTTGPPKQFPISFRVLEDHFIRSPLVQLQGDNPQEVPPFLLFFPLGNISGIYSTLPMMIRGQRVVLLERFSVDAWREYLVQYRPSHAGLPPSFVELVLDADVPKDDLASIKALGVGAAPLDPLVQKAFEDRYGIPILLSYGATEFAGPVSSMTPELHAQWGRQKLGTVGRALPGVELRVVDPETGAALPRGTEGLLEVVSPRLGPEWIRTSDIAVIDEDDFLFLRGRADGAIMRGGFKILPEAIERALTLHASVADAVVTGVPDRRLGQVPAAAVRFRRGAAQPSPAELEMHLRQHLLATHIPAKWLICEELPRTPSLKVDRAAVRQLFEEK